MGNNKLSNMIQINNIPWEGIKALSLIILKKIALIWVITFLSKLGHRLRPHSPLNKIIIDSLSHN